MLFVCIGWDFCICGSDAEALSKGFQISQVFQEVFLFSTLSYFIHCPSLLWVTTFLHPVACSCWCTSFTMKMQHWTGLALHQCSLLVANLMPPIPCCTKLANSIIRAGVSPWPRLPLKMSQLTVAIARLCPHNLQAYFGALILHYETENG